MKKVLTGLGIIGGIILGSEAEAQTEETYLQQKREYNREILTKICIEEEPSRSKGVPADTLIDKFDTIRELNYAKVEGHVTFSATVNSNRPFAIYKFTDPQDNEYQIMTGPENMFLREVYSIKYLELKEGETIGFQGISQILYTGGSEIEKPFEDIDGVLIERRKHNR